MAGLGKNLMVAGLVVAALGAVLWLLGPRMEGRGGLLPGDIVLRRPGFSLHFPVVSCLVASLLLTLLQRLFRR